VKCLCVCVFLFFFSWSVCEGTRLENTENESTLKKQTTKGKRLIKQIKTYGLKFKKKKGLQVYIIKVLDLNSKLMKISNYNWH